MCKLRGGSETLIHPWQEDARALVHSVLRSILLAGVKQSMRVVLSGGDAWGCVLTQKSAVAVCSSSATLAHLWSPPLGTQREEGTQQFLEKFNENWQFLDHHLSKKIKIIWSQNKMCFDPK